MGHFYTTMIALGISTLEDYTLNLSGRTYWEIMLIKIHSTMVQTLF